MTISTISPSIEPVLPGQNGWPAQGQWRYADYRHLPDDGRRYEIIEGVLTGLQIKANDLFPPAQ